MVILNFNLLRWDRTASQVNCPWVHRRGLIKLNIWVVLEDNLGLETFWLWVFLNLNEFEHNLVAFLVQDLKQQNRTGFIFALKVQVLTLLPYVCECVNLSVEEHSHGRRNCFCKPIVQNRVSNWRSRIGLDGCFKNLNRHLRMKMLNCEPNPVEVLSDDVEQRLLVFNEEIVCWFVLSAKLWGHWVNLLDAEEVIACLAIRGVRHCGRPIAFDTWSWHPAVKPNVVVKLVCFLIAREEFRIVRIVVVERDDEKIAVCVQRNHDFQVGPSICELHHRSGFRLASGARPSKVVPAGVALARRAVLINSKFEWVVAI